MYYFTSESSVPHTKKRRNYAITEGKTMLQQEVRKPTIAHWACVRFINSLNIFPDVLQVASNASIWSLSDAFKDKDSLTTPLKAWVTPRNSQG